ncbi:MAG: choice-of-anchor J domain-containing protein [Dysgonamonadaceae bacterium]|jgi:hypothetical protein|nr:choice-of-anchor J domain-containing protein [Dysgonamonadaceae bacterium]
MKRLITLLVLAIVLGLNLASQNSKSNARIGSVNGKEASLNRKSKLETKLNPLFDARMQAEQGALRKDFKGKEKGREREETNPFPNVKGQVTVPPKAANSPVLLSEGYESESITAPWSEGFEDDATLSSLLIYNMDGDETTWEINSDVSRTGARSAVHNWGTQTTQEDGWLVLPQINIPAGKIFALSFWSYNVSMPFGKNSVMVSTGSANIADEDFEEVWSQESPTGGDWVETKINLADYTGEDIYIAFRYEGIFAHIWYLDDISLTELTDFDAGVTAVVSPISGTLTSEETIQIKVKNFGAKALTEVPVKVSIDGGTPVPGTVSSLGINEEVEYNFLVPFDFSELKTYEITAYTELAGDGSQDNDSATVNVINVGNCVVSVFPYMEGMENDATLLCWNNFYYDEDGSDVGWTVVDGTSAHSGARMASHEYNNYLQQDGWMVSPQIKIPATGVYALSFWSFNVFADYYGKNSVLISIGSADPADEDFEEVWSPESVKPAWVETKISLAAYAGEDIYVAFRYEGTDAHIWYLDDLCIAEFPAQDAGVSRIVSPRAVNGGESEAPVEVEITNFGANPLTSVMLAYEFDGGEPVEETFTLESPIASFGTAKLAFTQTVDVSAAREEPYAIEVYTQLTGDAEASNDMTSLAFPYKGGIRLCGYRFYDRSGDYPDAVSFATDDPSDVVTISAYTDGDNKICSGEYVDDYIYGYTLSESGGEVYVKNFVKLTSDWTEVSQTPITEIAYDMAYDYSTGTMYALGYDPKTNAPQLKTVNLETGAMTYVADLDRDFSTLSIDLAGNLYAVSNNGNFTSINKTTGAVTIIGGTGVTPDYLQSAAFDHNTGRLFWAMCNTYGEGKLLEIDPSTGMVTDLGTLGGDAQIVALYTPYIASTELIDINIEDEAGDVDPDLAIVLTFDKAITAEAGLDGIQLVKDGTSEAVEITPSISGNVLTIAHAKLAFKTKYNLTIPEGTIDRFEGEIALSFTTADGGALPETKLLQAFTVFPNPSKGKVYLSSIPEKSKVTVLDLTGRTVATCTLNGGNNVPLNLPLSSGVYFIHIESAATKVIQKLVIE